MKHIIYFSILCLSGCLTLPQQHATNSHYTGLLAYQNNSESFTANFSLNQNTAQNYHLYLNGPFNSYPIEIEYTPTKITYKDGSKKILLSTKDAMPKGLPLNYITYWLQGKPAPIAILQQKIDKYNHLITLQQKSCSLQFARYTSKHITATPRKILINCANIRLKIILLGR